LGSSLQQDEDSITSGVIDPINGFAYFGTGRGFVMKIRLSEFTRVGRINIGEPNGLTNIIVAVIDFSRGYAYFGLGYESVLV
jgi:hypothetical protein